MSSKVIRLYNLPEYHPYPAAIFRIFLEQYFSKEDLEGPHLKGTARRVAEFWEEFFGEQDEFNCTTFPNDLSIDQMVIIEDIQVYSMCAHHFLPFFGKAHIAYIPTGELLGLSKFARVVKRYARRPQVQEELTEQIAEFLQCLLAPRGVAVVLQCEHLCMSMRGIENPGHRTTTSSLRGAFLEKDNPARLEFLQLVANK